MKCECIYCIEARWLKVRKPKGSRHMLIILLRHHLKQKGVTTA